MTPSDDAQAGAFAAPGSALGFMVQIDYALLSVLQRMEFDVDFDLSVETLDDIVFHEPETSIATDLIQSKYHVSRQAGIGDASQDLWKTLHNWIVQKTAGTPRLYLVTTAVAPVGSVAYHLRSGAERDCAAAADALHKVATIAGNVANAAYYAAYLGLENEARYRLLDRLIVLDGSYSAENLNDALLRAVRKSVFPNRRQALVDRLRGWWQRRVSRHLNEISQGRTDMIALSEVEEHLLTVAQSLRDDDLPIDFAQEPEPLDEQVAKDSRIFVDQLRLIQMGSRRLRQCIYDHNRAYLQRSQWQREDLLNLGELGQYDQLLKDEWRRQFTPITEVEAEKSESDVVAAAQLAFDHLDTSPLPRIRPHVNAGYVANGSLHMLADRLQIGWHPKWLDHLRHRLAELEDSRVG